MHKDEFHVKTVFGILLAIDNLVKSPTIQRSHPWWKGLINAPWQCMGCRAILRNCPNFKKKKKNWVTMEEEDIFWSYFRRVNALSFLLCPQNKKNSIECLKLSLHKNKIAKEKWTRHENNHSVNHWQFKFLFEKVENFFDCLSLLVTL